MSEWSNNYNEKAAAAGLLVTHPASDELFLDIDDEPSLGVFAAGLEVLRDLVVEHKCTPSPSGKPSRFHIRVKLCRDVRDELERVLLQALLGSDRLHEILSWRAIVNGCSDVTVLFERSGWDGRACEPTKPSEELEECPY